MGGTSTLFSRASAGFRTFMRGGIWRTTRRAARFRAAGFPGARPALMAAGGAVDITAQMARTTGRAAGGVLNWAGRHPWAATTTGIATMGAVGATRGIYAAGAAVRPVPPTNLPIPPTAGPGYNMWGSPSKSAFSAGNLGATGDLTLSLFKTRHG